MTTAEKREPKCPIPGYRFAGFSDWLHVRHAAETNVSLFYLAPLDSAPRPVLVRRVFKNGKVRIDAGEACFTADEGHLDRFYRLDRERPASDYTSDTAQNSGPWARRSRG